MLSQREAGRCRHGLTTEFRRAAQHREIWACDRDDSGLVREPGNPGDRGSVVEP